MFRCNKEENKTDLKLNIYNASFRASFQSFEITLIPLPLSRFPSALSSNLDSP